MLLTVIKIELIELEYKITLDFGVYIIIPFGSKAWNRTHWNWIKNTFGYPATLNIYTSLGMKIAPQRLPVDIAGIEVHNLEALINETESPKPD